MKMRSILVILSASLASALGELSPERKEELDMWLSNNPFADLSHFSNEERQHLKERAFEIQRKANYPRGYEFALIQLGDEKTVDAAVERLRANDFLSWDIIARTRQPLVIEKIAPELFKEQNYKTSEGDVKIFPSSFVATYILVQILEEAPQFSAEVRAWAKQLDPRNSWHNRIMFRRWWRDNEAFFKARDYARVRPGDVPPPLPDDEPPAPVKVIEPTGVSPAPPSPASAQPDAPPAPEAPSERNGPSWILAAGAGLALAVLCIALLRRKGRPS